MERVKYFENYLEIGKEIKSLVDNFVRAKVFIFGSVIRGDFSLGLSDIDVAIVSEEFLNREIKNKVYDALFFRYFEASIEFHLLTQREWEFYRRFIGKDFVEIK